MTQLVGSKSAQGKVSLCCRCVVVVAVARCCRYGTFVGGGGGPGASFECRPICFSCTKKKVLPCLSAGLPVQYQYTVLLAEFPFPLVATCRIKFIQKKRYYLYQENGVHGGTNNWHASATCEIKDSHDDPFISRRSTPGPPRSATGSLPLWRAGLLTCACLYEYGLCDECTRASSLAGDVASREEETRRDDADAGSSPVQSMKDKNLGQPLCWVDGTGNTKKQNTNTKRKRACAGSNGTRGNN